MSAPGRRGAGASLIELIVILLVIGALAATIAPRLSVDVFTADAQAQRLASDLRRAQFLAANSAASVCFALLGSNGYAVYPVDSSGVCLENPGQELKDPATGDIFRVAFANDLTISHSAGALPVVFNSWGIPTKGSAEFDLGGKVRVGVAATTGFVSISTAVIQ